MLKVHHGTMVLINRSNVSGYTVIPREFFQPQEIKPQKNIQTLNALTLTTKIHSSPMCQQMSLNSCTYCPYLPETRTFLGGGITCMVELSVLLCLKLPYQ